MSRAAVPELKTRLEAAIEDGKDDVCGAVLAALDGADVDLAMLEATRIGRVVSSLKTAAHASAPTRAAAAALVKRWKTLVVPPAQQDASREA